MIRKFRKKPVVIEAFQFNKTYHLDPIPLWMVDAIAKGQIQYGKDQDDKLVSLVIKTLEGWMEAQLGDYIIQGIKGEIYPCKPDIFEATYEEVTNEQ